MSAPRASASKPLDWSARSLRDLLLIDAFYAQFGVATAVRVVSAILEAAKALEQQPRIGVRGNHRGTRHQVVEDYPDTIVYRVRRSSVQIVRVLHQMRRYFN
jgi:plasmid stabilization system protein ParE